MALQIFINNVDMTHYIAQRTLKIDMDTSHWKTCSITLTDILINDGVPEEGSELVVNWIDGNTTIPLFVGLINNKNIKQLSPASNKLSVQLTSNGYRNIPARRTVTETFTVTAPAEYFTASSVIEYLITEHLSKDGITSGSLVEGKHYEDDLEYVCMNIGEILDSLASDSACTWYIDVNKTLIFAEEYATEDGNIVNDIDVERGITVDVRNLELKTDISNFANKVFFKGDVDPTDPATMENIQVFVEDTVSIAYMAALDGGSGVYGTTVSNPNIKTQAEAEAYCAKILDKRKVKPKSITFDTLNWLSFAVGEKQNVHIPTIGVHNTVDKPKNYVVESISLTDMGNGILSKKVDMRQLFSDVSAGVGAVTWQKGAQGVAFFAKLTSIAKQAENKAKDIMKNHAYVENLRGGVLSTQNFDGTGDYIQLQRQFQTWVDNANPAAPLVKMAQGFIKDKTGAKIPGIVFGAGDENVNDRGYITKGGSGLDIFYVTPTGGVARIRLGTDGKVYLNESEVQAFSATSQIPSEYISQANYWNTALNGMTYDGTNYFVGSGKLTSAVNTDIAKGVTASSAFDASGYLRAANIANASITTVALAGLSVDNSKLAALAVDASKLASGSVTATKIGAAAIGSAAIANGVIGTAHIASGTILDAYIQNLSADKITTGTLQGVTIKTTPNANSSYIELSSNSPELRFYRGSTSLRGRIFEENGAFIVRSDGDGTMRLGATGEYTYAWGTWDFYNASVTNFPSYTKSESNSNYAANSHTHSGYSLTSHNHDSNYAAKWSNGYTGSQNILISGTGGMSKTFTWSNGILTGVSALW